MYARPDEGTPMIDMTFEQVVKVVRRFRPEQKAALMKTLQEESVPSNLTRQELIAELDALRAAGAFDRVDSLRNQFASPALELVSDRRLLAAIHEASTDYEVNLAELSDHDN